MKGCSPKTNFPAHIDSYSLSAGLSLGLIVLGKGPQARGLADMKLEEQLRKFIIGGFVTESTEYSSFIIFSFFNTHTHTHTHTHKTFIFFFLASPQKRKQNHH